MTKLAPDGIIKIVREKKRQNKPSKGRNQWMFLKRCAGMHVAEIYAAAAESTRNSPPGTYQNGAWWERELKWNLRLYPNGKRRVMRLIHPTNSQVGVGWIRAAHLTMDLFSSALAPRPSPLPLQQ